MSTCCASPATAWSSSRSRSSSATRPKSPGIKRGGVLNIVRHEIELRSPGRFDPEQDHRRPRRPRHRRQRPYQHGEIAEEGGGDAHHHRARSPHRQHRRAERGAAEAGWRLRKRAAAAAAVPEEPTPEAPAVPGAAPAAPAPGTSSAADRREELLTRRRRCGSWSAWAIPARAMPGTGTISATWRWTRSPAAIASAPWKARFQGLVAEGPSTARRCWPSSPRLS